MPRVGLIRGYAGHFHAVFAVCPPDKARAIKTFLRRSPAGAIFLTHLRVGGLYGLAGRLRRRSGIGGCSESAARCQKNGARQEQDHIAPYAPIVSVHCCFHAATCRVCRRTCKCQKHNAVCAAGCKANSVPYVDGLRQNSIKNRRKANSKTTKPCAGAGLC